MSDESNKENEMTNLTSGNDIAETEDMSVRNDNDDTTETIPAQNFGVDTDDAETVSAQNRSADNKAISTSSDIDDTEAVPLLRGTDDAAETMPVQDTGTETAVGAETETGIGMAAETEAGEETETGTKTWSETGTGSAASDVPPQPGYAPPVNFASGPAPSGAYVRVPRDLPKQMPKPQPPAGPSKATILLSLLPLFLGAVMLIVASAFPMVFASVPGSVDVRSLIAMGIVVLGALLIALAVLLGLASLIHKGTAKWRARRRQ